ncbi:hypothetical protein D3C71_2033190 [compost metagenome]
MGQIGVKEVVAQHLGGILQILHAIGADGLHDVLAHIAQWEVWVLTKWRFHLRGSFFD